jgi:hypothetical protein
LKDQCTIFNVSFDSRNPAHPLARIPREDQDLVVELVLKSGSLKDLAAAYGVSYPTIRARLDKVIERLAAAVHGQKPDPVSELLAALVERGELTPTGARAVRDLVRRQARPSQDDPPSPGGAP